LQDLPSAGVAMHTCPTCGADMTFDPTTQQLRGQTGEWWARRPMARSSSPCSSARCWPFSCWSSCCPEDRA